MSNFSIVSMSEMQKAMVSLQHQQNENRKNNASYALQNAFHVGIEHLFPMKQDIQSGTLGCYVKFGRLMISFHNKTFSRVNIHAFTYNEESEQLGSFCFSDEDQNFGISAIGKYNREQMRSMELSNFTGAVAVFFVLLVVQALSEYNLPRGCWVPQVESEVIDWVLQFGINHPSADSNVILEKKKNHPVIISDDVTS